jgi:hypothetical protein
MQEQIAARDKQLALGITGQVTCGEQFAREIGGTAGATAGGEIGRSGGEQIGRLRRVSGPHIVPAGFQRVVEDPLAVQRGQQVQPPAAGRRADEARVDVVADQRVQVGPRRMVD